MSSHTHTLFLYVLTKNWMIFFFIDNKIEHAPKNTQTNDFFFLSQKKEIYFFPMRKKSCIPISQFQIQKEKKSVCFWKVKEF